MSSYISKLPKDVVVFEDYELRHLENCPTCKWGLFFCPRLRMVFLTGEWSDAKDRIQAIPVDEIDNYYVVNGFENFRQAQASLKKWLRLQALEIHVIKKNFPHKLAPLVS